MEITNSLLEAVEAVRVEPVFTTPELPATNSSFSKITPKLQIAWDSTSLKAAQKCWRLYEYTIINGYQAPGENVHLTFGILLHSATELYDHLTIGNFSDNYHNSLLEFGVPEAIATLAQTSGLNHDQAILVVLRYLLVATWDTKHDRPWVSTEPTKSRATLLRTIVLYLDRFKDESLKTLILPSGKPAVELSFRFEIDYKTTDGETIILCGHLDKVSEWNGELWIVDKKTSKYELQENYFNQFTPDTQVSLYSLAGNIIFPAGIAGMIIDAIQILVTGNRFRRKQIPRSPEYLEEWMQNIKTIFKEAEINAQDNYFPMNEQSCGWGNNQCPFRAVCSTDPSGRQALLDSVYTRRIWDPLQIR